MNLAVRGGQSDTDVANVFGINRQTIYPGWLIFYPVDKRPYKQNPY